jgi:hypothetical protein
VSKFRSIAELRAFDGISVRQYQIRQNFKIGNRLVINSQIIKQIQIYQRDGSALDSSIPYYFS